MKALAGFLVLCLVAVVYWPVTSAGFVWLDRVGFTDTAWVAYANDWQKLLTHDFYGWINYFRPLVVGLFALEVKIFGFSATSMHLVSLALHLLNTLLVGLLALKVLRDSPFWKKSILLCGLCMVLYGLHPALIEPVVWISCQFELAVTFFMLLGLWLNEKVESTGVRSGLVAGCFFLASCSKESALSFPFVLLLFDFAKRNEFELVERLRSVWQSQRYVYFAVFVAGVVYLISRHSSLGFLLQSTRNESAVSLWRFQEVCATYLTYWRVILWPMYKLGPLHELDTTIFETVNFESLITDAAAVLILTGGTLLALKRFYLGFVVMAATLSLLPVLHLLPVAFDDSFYHERYAMFAIAITAILLPTAIYQCLNNSTPRLVYWLGSGIAFVWTTVAVANIRVTIPLWSDEITLWRWMQRQHPNSLIVKDHLLSTYIELGDYKNAVPLADELVATNAPCPNCLLNAATLALAQNDKIRASAALEHLKESKLIAAQPRVIQGYVAATGRLLEVEGRTREAEEAYRGAVALNPLDRDTHIYLALLLAREQRPTEARNEADKALNLYPENERIFNRRMLDRELDANAAQSIK